jgi:hypothetical protein
MAYVTEKQATKMHKHHYHNINGADYADGQYRLQLRLLMLSDALPLHGGVHLNSTNC